MFYLPSDLRVSPAVDQFYYYFVSLGFSRSGFSGSVEKPFVLILCLTQSKASSSISERPTDTVSLV